MAANNEVEPEPQDSGDAFGDAFRGFFREHPAILLTCLYGQVTTVGTSTRTGTSRDSALTFSILQKATTSCLLRFARALSMA